MSIAEMLSSGLSNYKPIMLEDAPELFRQCCYSVCPNFVIDSRNKDLMNSIYKYMVGMNSSFDRRKGFLLWGGIGTGKSTIIDIVRLFDKMSNGRSFNGYHIGGFMIASASYLANQYSDKGVEALELYTYNKLSPITLAIDELGREPCPAKHFGTEMNVMQYILQCRYELRRDCITHVTTNLSPREIQNKYGSYIADRMNEMFNVVEVSGNSRR